METWEWVVIGAVLAGAVIFTLAWWWLADKWADSEHKRFKGKSGPPVERVVIKGTGSALRSGGDRARPEAGSRGAGGAGGGHGQ